MYDDYMDQLCALLKSSKATRSKEMISLENASQGVIESLASIAKTHNKIIFLGNGGSSGIASHSATDYLKNGRLRALTLSDAATLTCLSNDYGYERVYSEWLTFHGKENDLLFAISSSGQSENILNAVKTAKDLKMKVVTFSGFKQDNPLRALGDINFYIESCEYGFVELAHQTQIHQFLDRYMGLFPGK